MGAFLCRQLPPACPAPRRSATPRSRWADRPHGGRCPGAVNEYDFHYRFGASVEAEGRAVEQWGAKVAAEPGFTAVDHTVELSGLCPRCSLA